MKSLKAKFRKSDVSTYLTCVLSVMLKCCCFFYLNICNITIMLKYYLETV